MQQWVISCKKASALRTFAVNTNSTTQLLEVLTNLSVIVWKATSQPVVHVDDATTHAKLARPRPPILALLALRVGNFRWDHRWECAQEMQA